MAKQQIDPSQIDPVSSLPGTVVAFSEIAHFSGVTSSTYLSGSNISVTMPADRTTLVVHVSLGLYQSNSGASQSVIDLRDGLSGGGAMITRRVPTTARNYCDANMSYVLTGLTPGNTYSFSLTGRTSTGATGLASDSSSTNHIYAVLG